MRITINLATRPFVELRPLYARLRLFMGLLAVVAIGLGAALYFFSKRERAAEEQMDVLVQQTNAFQQERAQNEARMRQPQNRAVLDRAQFLNAVFAQKAFSWTSVMMDLEQVLPAGVQVTSIEPSVSSDGTVSIHLRVNGPRALEVDLIRNLEHSKRFLRPRLTSETAQAQESSRALPVAQTGMPGGVEFDILSGYNPLPIVKTPTKPPPPAATAKADGVMGAPKKISAGAVPSGTNANSSANSRRAMPPDSMPPRNQVPQPARPPVANGGAR